MPDGRYHHNIWRAGWPIAIWAIFEFTIRNPFVGIGTLIGYWIGKYITPDEDLIGISLGEGNLMRDFKLLGAFIVAYWVPYGYVFIGKHRSFWSHFPFISTLLRVIYMFWWVWIMLAQRGWLYDWSIWLFIGVWFGLSINDTSHALADLLIRSDEDEEIHRKVKRGKSGKF